MRVLVVDDDVELAETVALGLRRADMAVDIATNGSDGLQAAQINRYDVIVLDRDLPDLHGDDICTQLVATGSEGRVLMLTAAGGIDDLVDGLSLGADDYLSKPFAFAELVARIRALARRAHPLAAPTLVRADLELDAARHRACRAGKPLDLGPKEFGVLELLLAADGRVVPAEELLERVWDEAIDPTTTAVKVTLSRLRQKLGDPPLIKTIPKFGYRI